MICWSCERAAGDGITCGYCEALQPPDPAADHFHTLGVAKRFALDNADAEARFRALSRQLHPDRFAKADPRARRASLQRSAGLNEAWRTLKDPVRRAEYLLHLAGYEIGGEEGASRPKRAAKHLAKHSETAAGDDADGGAGKGAGAIRQPDERIPVSPALLGEILELREALGEARAAGDDARVQNMAGEIRGRIDVGLARVQNAFEQHEHGSSGGAAPLAPRVRNDHLDAVADELIAIRYYRRFLDEVAVHEETVAALAEGTTHA